VRVMTYNIRSLRDDPSAVVRVIRGADPDVLCIQEAPRFLFWRRKCARLAERTGLLIAAGGREAAANLLLVRPDAQIETARSVLFTKDPRLHQRGVAMALLRITDRRLVVAGTHLDGYPEPRLRHVHELFAALDGGTISVTDPTRRIDAVFAGPGLAVRTAATVDSDDVRIASDHRPVLADLVFV
jgi:endonuclease/exonuclease/phosphatase family metal-dependent hydrolase